VLLNLFEEMEAERNSKEALWDGKLPWIKFYYFSLFYFVTRILSKDGSLNCLMVYNLMDGTLK